MSTSIERLHRDAPDVLLVEDDPRQRAEFEEFFRRIGVTYRMAADGLNAIRILETATPKLVLLDIRLPGASGIEVAKSILRSGRQPVVLLMSGHADSVYDANRSTDQPFRVIEKPIELHILRKFIDEVMARSPGAPRAAGPLLPPPD